MKDRIEGLADEYRAGRPRTVTDDQVAGVIERTLNSTPKDATHWSVRSMAAETGLSHTTIRWIWNAFGLQPHRGKTFKLSTNPLIVDKVHDIADCIWHPRTAQWCCVLTKSLKFRRLTATTGPAHGSWRGRAANARPHPKRHDLAVCRT